MATFKRGKVWWFEFIFDGRRIQRSTKQGNRKAAIDIESAYRTALAKGEVGITVPKKETRTVADLVDGLTERYQADGRMSSQNICLLARVKKDFGSTPAIKLTAEDIDAYMKARLKRGDRPATVNRLLQVLRRCYTIAKPKLSAPDMTLLSEVGNARPGFLTAGEMAQLLPHLPEDGLRDYVEFAYLTGMRKSEISSLRWENLEKDGVLKLAAQDAKTRKARTVPVNAGELAAIIAGRQAARTFRNVDGSIGVSQFIFHRGDGQRIGLFRKSWKSATIAAGLGKWVKEGKRRVYRGPIFHDLRRSAIRDLIRAGVPQVVAMSISGHRTVSVFDRYNIVDESDKIAALRSAEVYRREQEKSVVSIGG